MNAAIRRSAIVVSLVCTILVSCSSGSRGTGKSGTTRVSAAAPTGPTTRPFFGVGTLTSDTSKQEGRGTGIGSPIGRWTYLVHESAFGANAEATGSITVSNGDQVFTHLDTTVVPGLLPPNARNRFVMKITGGTGRYARATGTAKGEVQEQKVALPIVESTVWWSGTIRY